MKFILSFVAGSSLLLAGCSAGVDSSVDAVAGSPSSGGAVSASGGAVDGGHAGTANDAGGRASDAGSGGSNGADPAGSGGAPATGGNSVGAAAGAGQAGDAGFAIDYSIWQLQLPSGAVDKPDTIPPLRLQGASDAYFYPAGGFGSVADGGQIFMEPPTGVGTGGSTHCRTELREMSPAGSGAQWSSTTTNTLTVEGKVIQCASCTIGQVFNSTDVITLAELQWTGGRMKLFYEEAKNAGLPPQDLGVSVPLNTRYRFTMSLTKGVLTVNVNGQQVYTRKPGPAVSASKFYFKAGNYDQDTKIGAVTTAVHSRVEMYSVVVSHT